VDSCGARYFFFFQAEDGIRDRNVTGVQTCALPIYSLTYRGYAVQDLAARKSFEEVAWLLLHGELPDSAELTRFQEAERSERTLQIGRASCRERGHNAAAASADKGEKLTAEDQQPQT